MEGRRVYVRMHGPEYLSDEELLRRAIAREDELERTGTFDPSAMSEDEFVEIVEDGLRLYNCMTALLTLPEWRVPATS